MAYRAETKLFNRDLFTRTVKEGYRIKGKKTVRNEWPFPISTRFDSEYTVLKNDSVVLIERQREYHDFGKNLTVSRSRDDLHAEVIQPQNFNGTVINRRIPGVTTLFRRTR